MGAVWRARYHRPGEPPLPVAVKALHPMLVDEGFRARFHAEVRAMVGLDHPGVVWVYDHGDAPAGHPQLAEGTPWVAMELARLGTLDDHRRDLTWGAVHAVLLELLDILAHAHAQGVVHRDLKPANVLVCGPRDPRPGLKLTDFGIAARIDDTTTAEGRQELVGTPSYMAPEQVSGAAADLGPWTDLYALGCVAWELITGAPPFHDASPRELLFAHLGRPVGPLEPTFDVPDAVEPWLCALLAKAPADRYTRAADARAVLRELAPGGQGASRVGELELALPAPTPTRLTQVTVSTWFDVAPAAADPSPVAAPERPMVAPSCPRRWQRPHPSRRQRQLQGAGLALVGLRSVPLAGRQAERSSLWRELLRVVGGEVRGVWLSGAAGTGKSRLAEWLRGRAEEVGAATALVARHTPDTPAGEGMRGALRRVWRGPLRSSLNRRLGAETARALDAWLQGRAVPPSAERQGLVAAALGALGRDRPVVLHVDDAQWAADAVGLVAYLHERMAVTHTPLLVVVTSQDEALAERPAAAEALAAWAARDEVTRLPVAPLPLAAQADLLDGLLHLAPAASHVVMERSGGHPLFAIQLVSEWVDRGWLIHTAEGFALEDPAHASALPTLDLLWTARLDRALEGLPPDSRPWLERAALWGDEVTLDALHALAEGLSLPGGPERLAGRVVDRLARARLAVQRPEGFAFAHSLVREALRQAAGDRLAAHHRLLARVRADQPIEAGKHWLQAGRPHQAARCLLAGLEEHAGRFGARAHAEVVSQARRALTEAGLDEADARWWPVHKQQLWITKRRGRGHEVDALLDDLQARVDAHGWPGAAVVARARVSRALDHEDLEGAEAWLRRGRAVATSRDDRVGLAVLEVALGEVANDLGRSAAAVEVAAAELQAGGDPRGQLRASMLRCVAGLMLDDMDRAEPHADEAVRRAEAWGEVTLLARCLHHQGKVSWNRGRYDEACRRLARSEGLFLRAGDPGLANPRVVRIQVRCVQGRYDEALALVLDLADRGLSSATSRLLEAVARVGRGELELVRGRLEELCAAFEARRRCNGEDALALEQLAELLRAEGADEAERVLRAALDQWARHDLRDAAEARVRERLRGGCWRGAGAEAGG